MQIGKPRPLRSLIICWRLFGILNFVWVKFLFIGRRALIPEGVDQRAALQTTAVASVWTARHHKSETLHASARDLVDIVVSAMVYATHIFGNGKPQ
jgi:hypothetical protein